MHREGLKDHEGKIQPREFTRAKAPRTPSSETFSFAAFASLREILRISGCGSAALCVFW
jgi:hypothetical protein